DQRQHDRHRDGRRGRADAAGEAPRPLPVARPPRPGRHPLHREARRPLRRGHHVLLHPGPRPAAHGRVRGRGVRAGQQPGAADRDPAGHHRGGPARARRPAQLGHRPGHRAAQRGRHHRSARCPVLRARVDEQPARGPLRAVGPARRAPVGGQALRQRPARHGRPGARLRAVVRHHRDRLRALEHDPRVPGPRRADLGAVPVLPRRPGGHPRRELAGVPLGDRPPAPRAGDAALGGARRPVRRGRLRDPPAGHDRLHRERHELARGRGVRPDHRSAGVRQLRLALHPVRHRLGGDAQGERARGPARARAGDRPPGDHRGPHARAARHRGSPRGGGGARRPRAGARPPARPRAV
ncbi:MAG: Inner membrane protein YhjD, partial [uncultured Actinomycetospora sp.]